MSNIPEKIIKNKVCPRCKRIVSDYETAYDSTGKAFGCTHCILDFKGGVEDGSKNN